MRRFAYKDLIKWQQSVDRKPLLIRGARQVGKTYTIRAFAKQNFKHFVEINCEVRHDLRTVFQKNLDVHRIIKELNMLLNESITPGETLLFFDEVQILPEAIQVLRYFYENMPNLHVIAAGSLIDFGLEKIGVPVGRISFLYIYPLSFMEFLEAHEEDLLIQEILTHPPEETINEAIHEKLLNYLSIYMAVGGMPKAVSTWLDTKNIEDCSAVHFELIAAYRQDFLKYAKHHQLKYLDLLLNRIPYQLGKIFKFSKISQEYRKRELEPCLDLLVKAGVVHCVRMTDAQGLPLGAGVHPDRYKIIFLDVALTQTLLGLQASNWLLNGKQFLQNYGQIVEAFVGQELLAYGDSRHPEELYYWEKIKGSAEVDYVIQRHEKLIPIEVKSATGGQLKSLYYFLETHPQVTAGIRFSTHNYSVLNKLISLPLYAVQRYVTL